MSVTDTRSPYKAPRFHAEFQRLEGRSVLLMSREEWERMKANTKGQPVSIDVAKTPLKRLTTEVQLAAVIAERRSDYEVTITIYREDAADAPRGAPINVDRYSRSGSGFRTIWTS